MAAVKKFKLFKENVGKLATHNENYLKNLSTFFSERYFTI